MPDELVVAVTQPEYLKGRAVFDAASGKAMRCVEAPPYEPSLAAFLNEHGICNVIVGIEPYLDALYEALPEGVETLSKPQTTESGSRILFLRDPEDNLVEIIET